jgi:hypothetical protein
MAKPNYAFAKRQRDLAKKQKKEEKKLRKAGPTEGGADTSAESQSEDPDQAVDQGAAHASVPGPDGVVGSPDNTARDGGQATS